MVPRAGKARHSKAGSVTFSSHALVVYCVATRYGSKLSWLSVRSWSGLSQTNVDMFTLRAITMERMHSVRVRVQLRGTHCATQANLNAMLSVDLCYTRPARLCHTHTHARAAYHTQFYDDVSTWHVQRFNAAIVAIFECS